MKKDVDIEKKWKENIEEAKTIIGAKNYSQMEIARLCLEVCEITRGGNSKSDGFFTIKRFAKESGITAKTLSAWVCVYRNVYKKLDVDLKVTSSYTALAIVTKMVSADERPEVVRKKVRDYINLDDFDARLLRYCGQLRGLAHNFESKDAVNRAKIETLEELAFYCEMIMNHIKRARRGVKPKFNGVSSNYDLKSGLNANGSVSGREFRKDKDGFRVSISNNDKKILEHLKSLKEATPTVLGQFTGGKTPMARKLSALRSLKKLEGLDLVVRIAGGKYKAQPGVEK